MTTICEQGKPHACLVQATTHPAAKSCPGNMTLYNWTKGHCGQSVPLHMTQQVIALLQTMDCIENQLQLVPHYECKSSQCCPNENQDCHESNAELGASSIGDWCRACAIRRAT